MLNLGICYFETNKLDQAHEILEKARDLFQEIDSPEFLQKVKVTIGRVFLKQDQQVKAHQQFSEALEVEHRTEIVKLIEGLQLSQADQLCYKFGLEKERVEEGLTVGKMIEEMPKSVVEGSQWFVVGMSWIRLWQQWVYFDIILGNSQSTEQVQTPPKVCSNDILTQKLSEHSLMEQAKKLTWQNLVLMPNLVEGSDFMLLTPQIYTYLKTRYGDENPIERYAIKQPDGEVVVELYLTKLDFFVFPNDYFKWGVPKSIFVSRALKLEEVKNKLSRILCSQFVWKFDRSVNNLKTRVWKSLTNNVEEIKGLAVKIKNFTSVQIDAELLDSNTDTVQEWSIAPDDILIIEAPKNNSVDWVFQSISQAKDEVKTVSSENWAQRDVTELFDGKSKRGLTGLGNLGNTCFMNSGLQCMANSMELTNYFLFGKFKSDINKSNPLGMGGKLATAYAGLMQEMWCGGSSRLAPIDLKKTLGQKISRFSGYGQQDSQELVNYMLDLLHEDLNQITKKPYTEMSEEPDRPDAVVAKEFWDAFLARNKSIIIDLLYGQLKSTVQCLTCQYISVTFDPFMSVSLPITRQKILEVGFVPLRNYTSKGKIVTFPVVKLIAKAGWTVSDLKNKIKSDLKLSCDLQIALQRNSSIQERLNDDTQMQQVQNDGFHMIAYEYEPCDYLTELNFFTVTPKRKNRPSQTEIVEKSVPRLIGLDGKDTVLMIKRKIVANFREMFDQDLNVADEEQLNSLIELQMRNKQGDCKIFQSKILANELEEAKSLSLQSLIDGVGYNKPNVVFSIVVRAGEIKEKDLQPRYELATEDASEKGVTLASCFVGNERREVLGGSDQWYCRKCKEHRDITKKIELYKVPRLMILQLKRFTSKKSANTKESGLFNLAYAQICQQEKVGELVNFPVEGLDMRPYVLTLKNEPKPVLYDLYAVSNHYGSLNGGHYTASVKNQITGKWYYMNDSSCSEMQDSSEAVSNAAYLLFYRKR